MKLSLWLCVAKVALLVCFFNVSDLRKKIQIPTGTEVWLIFFAIMTISLRTFLLTVLPGTPKWITAHPADINMKLIPGQIIDELALEVCSAWSIFYDFVMLISTFY